MDDISYFQNRKFILHSHKSIYHHFSFIVFSLFLVFFLTFFFFFPVSFFKTVEGRVIKEEEQFLLELYFPKEEKQLFSYSSFFINQQQYDYNIIQVKDQYIADLENRLYLPIVVNYDMDDSLKISNTMVSVVYSLPKITLAQYLFEKIRKGI